MSGSEIVLFPFGEYWWFYLAFTGFVLLLLALDLGVFHREAHEVSFREAVLWSAVWMALALAFNAGLYYYTLSHFDAAAARETALEFLTGYVVEKSLSVDNIFVFVVVFRYFGIPSVYQHRVLFFGIIGAFIFRAIFISIGAVLMRYHWVVVLFGGVLILTGLKLFFAGEKPVEPDKNPLIRLFRSRVPVTPELHGQNFFVRIGAVRHATPLFVALLFLEMTDIIFAVDSVPAIFALTSEPLIVFTSNIFAILGLRAMYFMLAGAIDKFYLLKYGLAAILVFVGLKMVWLNQWYGGKFPIGLSLGIIAGILALSIGLSLLLPPKARVEPAA